MTTQQILRRIEKQKNGTKTRWWNDDDDAALDSGQMINWSTIWNYTNTQIHILLQIQKQRPTPNTVKVGQREG